MFAINVKPERFSGSYVRARMLSVNKPVKAYHRIRGHEAVRLRRSRLRQEPLCRICKSKGRTTAATVPDHIKPLAHGGDESPENIRCLCHECHVNVTAEQFGYKKKPRFGVDGWPID